jgi:hypothetical protein
VEVVGSHTVDTEDIPAEEDMAVYIDSLLAHRQALLLL